jgi:carboxymethylenebutenolidase
VKPGPERDRVFALIHSLNGPKVLGDTAAILEFLDRHPAVTGKVGVVGYCMGGGYALRAAGTYPDRIGAAASFHGGGLATDAPDSPHTFAPRITAKVYIGVAEIDHMFSDAERERLRQALEAADVDFTIEVYPGVKHGFAVTGHPVYDAAGSERHWQVLLRLFSDALPG